MPRGAKARASFKAALLAVLTAIPTGLGYVLGPIAHSADRLLSMIVIPGLGPLPWKIHLGFMPLVVVTILARVLLGRGAAILEGILLAITGIIFHPSKPAVITGPRDVLLGVGVELVLLKEGEGRAIGTAEAVVAGFFGGLLSYLPFLAFAPLPGPYALQSAALFYISILVMMSSYLVDCLIGGFIAGQVVKALPSTWLAGRGQALGGEAPVGSEPLGESPEGPRPVG